MNPLHLDTFRVCPEATTASAAPAEPVRSGPLPPAGAGSQGPKAWIVEYRSQACLARICRESLAGRAKRTLDPGGGLPGRVSGPTLRA